MKSIIFSFVALVTVSALTLSGCASQPKPDQKKVSLGMDKDDVLEIMGSPSRSKRVKGADKWSYDQYLNDKKSVVNVYFQEGKVSFVGSDEELESILKSKAAEKTGKQPAPTPAQEGFKDMD